MRQAEAFLPTSYGNFTMIAYSDDPNDPMPNIALVHEDFDANQPTVLRIHSECMTGDVFSSKKCDCGEQLHHSMELIRKEVGVLVYLRQEGRGIGLINKLKAYKLQENGLNTIDANLHLGFQEDERQYKYAVEILKDLKIQKIRLITNNPLKIKALKKVGFLITERIPIIIAPQTESKNYLEVKRDIMGHLL
ncbi:MAG: GTP cyclohydrolase II [Saprospiraceae bacterium]